MSELSLMRYHFPKKQSRPWETKKQSKEIPIICSFFKATIQFATIVPPSENALLFYSPWLGKFKKFKQFLRWAAANPKACTMLLLALAIKQKKLMGQTSQEGGAAGTWCKDICYETKPFCFEDKNAELLQKAILYDHYYFYNKGQIIYIQIQKCD